MIFPNKNFVDFKFETEILKLSLLKNLILLNLMQFHLYFGCHYMKNLNIMILIYPINPNNLLYLFLIFNYFYYNYFIIVFTQKQMLKILNLLSS